uniref:Uncharacterized protein n=1 Tax=viral metagenome TaxID=1070528 RepID=A0A6C0JQG1_9ZZZZ
MDLVSFWDNITFKFDYREKGLFVMTATVDSGVPVQLKIVSKNKADKLRNMDWQIIYGIPPKNREAVQYFRAPYNLQAVLEEIPSKEPNQILYVHRWEPYTVTRFTNPTVMDMSIREDNLKLSEAISTPSFTIKRLRKLQ